MWTWVQPGIKREPSGLRVRRVEIPQEALIATLKMDDNQGTADPVIPFVMPAQAGIQRASIDTPLAGHLDSRLRGNDNVGLVQPGIKREPSGLRVRRVEIPQEALIATLKMDDNQGTADPVIPFVMPA